MKSGSNQKQKTVLLCISGCIAAYKACEIVRGLQKSNIRVKVCMTEHATSFIGPTTFRSLTHEEVAVDLFDNPSDPIHHISLAKEPDVVLVAPATANIVAKIAHGEASDLLTTTVLATDAPVIIAPAMNVAMWQAQITQQNIESLKQRGIDIIQPDNGYLACGDVGEGKLAPVDSIVARTIETLETSDLLKGEHVLITAGGTHEAIDPVRYIANHSSGKMGYALARAACAMGAKVTLISGPTTLGKPFGITTIPVVSAAEMHAAVMEHLEASTIFIGAAAVADYTPQHPASEKLSKADGTLESIALVKTQDILASVSQHKGNRIVIGFAAETNNLQTRAKDKLARKNCDAIVANDVSRPESTFGSNTNTISWVTKDGIEELPTMGKQQLAFELLKRIYALKS